MNARRLRIALQVCHSEDRRAVYHPVHEQLVLVGVDGRNACVVPLEVQVGRGDGTAQILQWRARGTGEPGSPSQSARLLAGCALTEFRNEPAGHLGGIRSHLDLLRVQLEGISLSLDQAGGDGAGGRAQPGTT